MYHIDSNLDSPFLSFYMRLRKPPKDLVDKFEDYLSDTYVGYLKFLSQKGAEESKSNPALQVLSYIDKEMKTVSSFEEALDGNRHCQGALNHKKYKVNGVMDENFIIGLRGDEPNLRKLGKAARMKSGGEYMRHEMMLVKYVQRQFSLTPEFLSAADSLVMAAIQDSRVVLSEDDLDDSQKEAIGMELETEEEEEEEDEIDEEIEPTDGWL